MANRCAPFAVLLAVGIAGIGCSSHSQAARPAGQGPEAGTAAAATQPAEKAESTSYSEKGISISWPGTWSRIEDKDYEVMLVPQGEKEKSPRGPTLSLDVPDLPPHIPGMIPIGSVKNGYLDDLKKEVGPLHTQDLPKPNIPDAKVREVRSSWQDKQGSMQETTVLLVHSDAVYIIRSRSDVAHESTTHAGFDAILKSLKWAGGSR